MDLNFQINKREKLSDQLYGQLLKKIVAGELKEGDKLPSENEIAQMLSYSVYVRHSFQTDSWDSIRDEAALHLVCRNRMGWWECHCQCGRRKSIRNCRWWLLERGRIDLGLWFSSLWHSGRLMLGYNVGGRVGAESAPLRGRCSLILRLHILGGKLWRQWFDNSYLLLADIRPSKDECWSQHKLPRHLENQFTELYQILAFQRHRCSESKSRQGQKWQVSFAFQEIEEAAT